MALRFGGELNDSVHSVTTILENYVLRPSENNDIVSRISLPRAEVLAAYMILAITRPSVADIAKWKVAINGIALTREFKPHIDIDIDGRQGQSLFIYDISKILQSDSIVRVSYRGRSAIKIEFATLIAIYRYRGFHTYFDCEVDLCRVENVEKRFNNYTPKFVPNQVKLNMGLIVSRFSKLLLKTDSGKSIEYNVVPGFNAIELDLDSVPKSIAIEGNEKGARSAYTCIFLAHALYPKLSIDRVALNERGLLLTVVNQGDNRPDDVELVLLRYGVPIYRTSVEPIDIGEKRELLIPFTNMRRYENLVLRVIWHKGLRTFVEEKLIKA